MKKLSLLLVLMLSFVVFTVNAQQEMTLTPIGTFDHGGFDEGAAEIVAYDAATKTLFVVNGETETIDLLDITDPTAPALKDKSM